MNTCLNSQFLLPGRAGTRPVAAHAPQHRSIRTRRATLRPPDLQAPCVVTRSLPSRKEIRAASSMGASAIVYIATSLDGYIARPDGGIDWLPPMEEGEDFGFGDFMASVDAVVMGRKTYEQVLSFVGPWPYSKPVTVLSTTLKPADVPEHLTGKVTVTSQAPTEVLEALGSAGASRVYVDGGTTIKGFLEIDAVDEMTITSIPVLIGSGIPLFGQLKLGGDKAWEYKSTESLEGMVKNTWQRRR